MSAQFDMKSAVINKRKRYQVQEVGIAERHFFYFGGIDQIHFMISKYYWYKHDESGSWLYLHINNV